MDTQYVLSNDRWNEILRVLPSDLEESAREYNAVKRLRKVSTAGNLLRMILAYGLSDFSLKDTAAVAKADGIASFTGQAFHYRLRNSEKWLVHLLGQVLFQHRPENPTVFPIRVVDGTVITGPGSKGTDWVVHMTVDPISGQFSSVEITDAKGAETFGRHCFNPGEIVLGDRMYATARGIKSVLEQEAFPVVRVNPYSLKVCDLNKQRIHLQTFEGQLADNKPFSLDVLIPTPPDMTGKKSKAWDISKAKSWIAARIVGARTKKGVIWVLTTLSREQLSDRMVLQLYRLRWQVELLFKRLKSLLHLDDLPTKDGPISKVWILGRLLAAAIAQALVNPTAFFSPRGKPRERRVRRKSQRLVTIPGSPMGSESGDPRKRLLAAHNRTTKP